MDNDRRILQISTAVLLGAVILRLLSGPLGTAARRVDTSDIATALLFLQTGRVVRLADTPQQSLPEDPPHQHRCHQQTQRRRKAFFHADLC